MPKVHYIRLDGFGREPIDLNDCRLWHVKVNDPSYQFHYRNGHIRIFKRKNSNAWIFEEFDADDPEERPVYREIPPQQVAAFFNAFRIVFPPALMQYREFNFRTFCDWQRRHPRGERKEWLTAPESNQANGATGRTWRRRRDLR